MLRSDSAESEGRATTKKASGRIRTYGLMQHPVDGTSSKEIVPARARIESTRRFMEGPATAGPESQEWVGKPLFFSRGQLIFAWLADSRGGGDPTAYARALPRDCTKAAGGGTKLWQSCVLCSLVRCCHVIRIDRCLSIDRTTTVSSAVCLRGRTRCKHDHSGLLSSDHMCDLPRTPACEESLSIIVLIPLIPTWSRQSMAHRASLAYPRG